ncbi:MAG: hypothetical protein L7F77_15530 [Candidatus Magnetominusculus sp. LBB02]|nr:hypothetical protein [Candidatus Magnetominusculus sp. LBB02]
MAIHHVTTYTQQSPNTGTATYKANKTQQQGGGQNPADNNAVTGAGSTGQQPPAYSLTLSQEAKDAANATQNNAAGQVNQQSPVQNLTKGTELNSKNPKTYESSLLQTV